jgi:hypothetical protein
VVYSFSLRYMALLMALPSIANAQALLLSAQNVFVIAQLLDLDVLTLLTRETFCEMYSDL